jgi:cysteine desulfurase family protein (TIGR01976 family)
MEFDVDAARDRFPALALRHDGAPRVYLDNPAGTQLPQQALDRMQQAMVECNANMNGAFRTSQEATALVAETHAALADMVNAASTGEVVVGANMTTLTFMMSRVLAPRFQPGDEIITTHMDHEGNRSPWLRMAEERGLVVKHLGFDRDTYEFDLDEFDALITDRTRFAALNYSSNLLGTINPIEEMCRRLRAVGALTYVDAVQYAPHGVVDVQRLGCDLLVMSAYKFYGPHVGVLWGREDLLTELEAYKLRHVPDVPPQKFETGAQSLVGLAGTLGAAEYLQWLADTMGEGHEPPTAGLRDRTRQVHTAMRAMIAYEETITERLVDGLTAIDGVRVHGITDRASFARRVPTVSISADGADPARMAAFLDEHGVYVWNGHCYAPAVVEWLGLAEAGGMVRIGPTHYNTLDEVDRAVELVDTFLTR